MKLSINDYLHNEQRPCVIAQGLTVIGKLEGVLGYVKSVHFNVI